MAGHVPTHSYTCATKRRVGVRRICEVWIRAAVARILPGACWRQGLQAGVHGHVPHHTPHLERLLRHWLCPVCQHSPPDRKAEASSGAPGSPRKKQNERASIASISACLGRTSIERLHALPRPSATRPTKAKVTGKRQWVWRKTPLLLSETRSCRYGEGLASYAGLAERCQRKSWQHHTL